CATRGAAATGTVAFDFW
nr:immunoglobulin heavy chain junction region [Macaca mulatta]MOW93347.1 immunoglobulin heavy chain junction region [Macaca mulatta]MOW93425.1 immunoglobulin heavy chain junction region [Macaca mulatta]MOW93477.1 immunoglobulin heavy chain junction region [Macaca mulatta]MOW93497.1 immunoglobulin heavy chain junction region [Macaca mulatta]